MHRSLLRAPFYLFTVLLLAGHTIACNDVGCSDDTCGNMTDACDNACDANTETCDEDTAACVCKDGFELQDDACVKIDDGTTDACDNACDANTETCDEDSAACVCKDGFELQDDACVKIDDGTTDACDNACDADTETCDEDTAACVCKDGFELQDDACVKIVLTAWCVATNLTDFGLSGSQLAVLDLESLEIKEDLAAINEDAGIVAANNALYAINRISFNGNTNVNNVQKISTDEYQTVWHYGVQPSSYTEWNPQTMAVHGTFGYIPLLDAGVVVKVDLDAETEEDFIVDTLEIPVIDDFDGDKSEPTNVIIHQDTLYVLSQGLNGWACDPGAYSQLLAYDLDLQPYNAFDGSNTLDLATCNGGSLAVVGDTLYVQSIGLYRAGDATDEDDGGIEAIDLTSGQSEGLIVTEADVNDQDIYDVFADEENNGLWIFVGYAALHYVDLSDHSVQSDAYFNGVVTSVLPDGDRILVGAQDGIHVIDVTSADEIQLIETSNGADGLVLFARDDSCF